MDLNDTREAATRMLASIVDRAASLGVTLPDRQFANVGGIVHDCEQVSASALSLSLGLSGATGSPETTGAIAFPCDPIWKVNSELVIVRCAKAVSKNVTRGTTAPPVEDYAEDLQTVSRDAAVLTQAIMALAGEGGVPTMDVRFAQPQGGMISTTVTASLNLWF
jgi:hypothetical protein